MEKPSHPVIDGDGHICEPEIIWTEYTRAEFRERVLQIRTHENRSHLCIENRVLAGEVGPAQACIPGGMAPGQEFTWHDILPGSYDPKARIDILDQEGIDRALLFPSVHLLWGDVGDPEVSAETCRAYNNWMSDFCREDPSRLFGMGIVPLQDVDLAVEEVKRLRGLGLRGLTVRPERFGGLALYDERCDALWSIAQADGIAVGVHGSFGTRMPGFARGRYDDNLFMEHMVAHPFGQMAVMMDLMAGGVTDRFPDLRVGFFESGLGWIPYWLNRLDEHFEVMGHHTPGLRRRPSEIFRQQCFVSMEPDELEGLRWMMEKDLLPCILWGSDYPHFDCTYPGGYTAARETFETAGSHVSKHIVYENPKRYMGLSGED